MNQYSVRVPFVGYADVVVDAESPEEAIRKGLEWHEKIIQNMEHIETSESVTLAAGSIFCQILDYPPVKANHERQNQQH